MRFKKWKWGGVIKEGLADKLYLKKNELKRFLLSIKGGIALEQSRSKTKGLVQVPKPLYRNL